MVKFKLLAVIGLCGIVLGACGEKTATTERTESQSSATEESSTVEESTTVEESSVVESTEKASEVTEVNAIETDSEVIESEFGTITTLAQVKDINETQLSGPFKITVEAIQKSQLQPSADYVEMFGGENLAVITIQLSVENTNGDTNMIYPDQGTIVTDTKQQVEAEMFLSDSVGGDFIGEVVKNGAVQFIFDGNAEDIKSFKYIVGSGSDPDWNYFGEDLTFDFSF